jgi:hypothetical protein
VQPGVAHLFGRELGRARDLVVVFAVGGNAGDRDQFGQAADDVFVVLFEPIECRLHGGFSWEVRVRLVYCSVEVESEPK